MDLLTIGIIGIVILIVILFLGMNIGITMITVGFFGFMACTNFNAAMGMLKSTPFNTVANFSLSVIPLFVLMGQFAYYSGLSQDLYAACYKILGRLPGGLAVATIGACGGFAAICGSSTATTATMGTVCVPEMKKYNYKSGLATGSVAAGGTLGILIPPSVGFIVYGIVTEQSIGTLFAAGILPGIMLMVLYMVTVVIIAVRDKEAGPPGPKFTAKEKFDSIKGLIPVAILFILVIGGILFGLFTANEGAAVGAFGAFIFLIIRGKCTKENVKAALSDTIKTSSMIFLIMIGAYAFGYFLAVSKLPMALASAVAGLPVSPYVILILILVVYIAMGCIMDSLAMILLLTPIFFPIAQQLGMNPIWFGVLMVMVQELGLITPPVGMNIYVMAGIAKGVPIQTIFKGAAPFIVTLLVATALVIVFPPIATFLPSLM
jgi:C4-dicarboxylate transporter DctM subunit